MERTTGARIYERNITDDKGFCLCDKDTFMDAAHDDGSGASRPSPAAADAAAAAAASAAVAALIKKS